MEPIWKLMNLVEPASISLILTAIGVTVGSAFRAVNYGRVIERNEDLFQPSTLDKSQALMLPVICSCSLLMMFYSLSSISHILTGFIAIVSALCLHLCLSSYAEHIKSRFGFTDPFMSWVQALLLLLSMGLVVVWLVSGNWILNNLLAISICVTFVTYVRLPNLKICVMLLVCLFVYDVFWVFYSKRFFGKSVMEAVAAQLASNPVHTVTDSLSVPGSDWITKKLKLPIVIIFPQNILRGLVARYNADDDFLMLGLGDMGVPSMLLALLIRFDDRKRRDSINRSGLSSPKGFKYIWYAVAGYSIGLITASAAGILTNASQPALLYLVPSTLGPIILISWMRKELAELWEGRVLNIHLTEA